MAGRKTGWNVHRRNAGSRGPLGSHSGKANVRKVDQPGPGRTGTRAGSGATEEVWNDSEVGGVVVLEDCGGRARVGDSRGGRGLGRLGSFEHAAGSGRAGLFVPRGGSPGYEDEQRGRTDGRRDCESLVGER